jgi:putative OPT family oligopeptide transporter
MIPMRRYIIVEEHGNLPFPEGTACAEILKSGENSAVGAMQALWGVIVGAVYKACSSAFFIWKETPEWTLSSYQRTIFSIDASPALLGVGYIIGPKFSAFMLSGGALGWWVIIPLIRMFDTGGVPIYPATESIAQMSANDIWANYVRYIGAGAVALGGILSLVRIIPLIGKTLKHGFSEIFSKSSEQQVIPRTQKDIPLTYLLLGSIAVIFTIWIWPDMHLNFLTIVLMTILAFFFVAVTSITVGLIGSSSNPVSGMTITTLLITCLIFLALNWTERVYLIAAITMCCVVNIAICIAGTTSQDLKTGFLLGATPRLQQIGELIAVLFPALMIGSTVYLLNEAYTIGSNKMPAPQATLVALIAKGVLANQLPVTLVVIGAVIAGVMALLRVPVLPFAIGLYLPISLSTAVMVGGIAAFILHTLNPRETASEKGVLMASGFVGGDAVMGVVIAMLTVMGVLNTSDTTLLGNLPSFIIYLALAAFLVITCTKNHKEIG